MTLMCAEVGLMFLIVMFQGLGRIPIGGWGFETGWPFKLDKWVLGAFEAGVLLQTFGLARIIAKHLFPIEKDDDQ